ncbi:S-adenosyl-L-methionine-dependent methyltransferase [Stachybotrys elegans]|uniref:tRNA wybutosine-synthesizing protein 4 n=1 Tax=Stachybotrys elegans TaxID=80388 RepID=A0A8K0SQ75_9HYPO|nr:S-adenosyl-L-methionine-dependent methyltransferase [Stachybotrys elegans]
MSGPTTPSSRPTKSQLLDDLIMGTNSSSITSKRSVERFYYPNEPHFFRYFVKKFQRRAPLINRGYWLRLRAIDVIVRQFLSRPSTKRKVVINLGCGSDVLPWQCHTRYPDACSSAVFIDIDYPDLMNKKRTIVLETPQLRELLGPDPFIGSSNDGPLLLRSEKYCQLACDLRQLDKLRQALESLLELDHCEVLFVAEVSITYMDTKSADALINWASSIGQAEFCLLEQILPHGPQHPFAQTMLSHFDKLSTPPKSVGSYPTTQAQKARFQERGWLNVKIWDLWEAWSSGEFVTAPERAALDDVEPFDEWEEFMLFARHYFVIHASALPPSGEKVEVSQEKPDDYPLVKIESTAYPTTPNLKRRFGSSMVVSNMTGEPFVVHALGLGNTTRADSYDVFAVTPGSQPPKLPTTGPSARMCFTLTDLGQVGLLLTGGRGSPSSSYSDCWLFTKGIAASWQPTWSLPVPLFRHAALRLRQSSCALIAGGKTSASQISRDFFVFHPERGWLRCNVLGDAPEPTFGGALCNAPTGNSASGSFKGILSGGIDKTGLVCCHSYLWDLDMTGTNPVITFKDISSLSITKGLSLMGSQVVDLGTCTAICGGMGEDPSAQGQNIVFLVPSDNEHGFSLLIARETESNASKMPFMIGSSVVSLCNRLIVTGGGATCFSMGTFSQTDVFSITLPEFGGPWKQEEHGATTDSLTYLTTHKLLREEPQETDKTLTTGKAVVTAIPRVQLTSSDHFVELLRRRQPVVLTGLQLGDCTQKWTPEHMVELVGGEKEVVVHECLEDTDGMDFNSKNFRYITQSFHNVMSRVQEGQRLYLRSLSQAQPSDSPANLGDDFPALAREFTLPPELEHVKDNHFSSILRVSGRVNMWLHYDVMANVYAQIQGSKRMVLFPPSDVTKLSFAPGASSSSLNVFAGLDTPSLANTRPHEAILSPGDVLLLPPMWLHTAHPETPLSIAVNVFFRDLDSGYSTGRDVYGNRDLAAYEKSRLDVARIAKAFQTLPPDIRDFYLKRLGDELAWARA